MELRDTVAVVTGGGTGIGRATAPAPARSGSRAVVVTYSRSTADAEAAVAELVAVPLRRTAGPGHVAQAVLGLLAMDFVTGEAVIVDGGKHIVY